LSSVIRSGSNAGKIQETLHAFCGVLVEKTCLIGEFEEQNEMSDGPGRFETANHAKIGLVAIK
jgi:hypothetical protein